MKHKFIGSERTFFQSQKRIRDISIIQPQIRSEFYVRLFSLLKTLPEITDEGYEFFIQDTVSGLKFSAGLTGFGPGYFATKETNEVKQLIERFHSSLFNSSLELNDCKIEFEHDFRKTILGYENGKLIELDITEE
jgi:hypothetical protein